MAEIINEIVQITITRQTAFAKIPGFNGIIIVDEFDSASITPAFTERVREYTSLTGITDAGFATSSAVYLAASALFSQNPNVGSIFVGRKETVADGGPETWTVALTAIKNASNAWYALHVGTRTLADLQEVADWTQANKRLFITSDDDSNIISGTGDIAEYLDTQNYDRSAVMYHPDADLTTDDPFAETAWTGYMFTKDPGSATWNLKPLVGVPAYDLEVAQINTALGKNCNLFQEIATLDRTRFGTVGSGEYIDIMRGTDWLEATIQIDLFNFLQSQDKVAFTDGGIQGVKQTVEASLQKGVDRRLLAPGYEVTVPLAANVSAGDKADRLLPDVTFTATYQGAIHKTEVQGTISL